MLQATTLKFIQQLAKNNNKPWFDSHKDAYITAKEDFETLVTGIINGLSVHEPVFKEQKAKDCVFRIFRDVRFSKDKTPYKAHFGAFFSKGGRKFPGAGYYLHIEPGGKSFIGGGMWMPESPLLKNVRQEIDYNFEEFQSIINGKKFKKLFTQINGEHLMSSHNSHLASSFSVLQPSASFCDTRQAVHLLPALFYRCLSYSQDP
jgi:uncharacterized protein (TIGR02453 family)